MQTAQARSLRADHHEAADGRPGLSLLEPEDREAVLHQWEAKIESSERRSGGEREDGEASDVAEPASIPESAPASEPPSVSEPAPVAERRTVTITGQPYAHRRRATMAERHIAARPDSIALWAFLLGLLLVAVAAGSAHA